MVVQRYQPGKILAGQYNKIQKAKRCGQRSDTWRTELSAAKGGKETKFALANKITSPKNTTEQGHQHEGQTVLRVNGCNITFHPRYTGPHVVSLSHKLKIRVLP